MTRAQVPAVHRFASASADPFLLLWKLIRWDIYDRGLVVFGHNCTSLSLDFCVKQICKMPTGYHPIGVKYGGGYLASLSLCFERIRFFGKESNSLVRASICRSIACKRSSGKLIDGWRTNRKKTDQSSELRHLLFSHDLTDNAFKRNTIGGGSCLCIRWQIFKIIWHGKVEKGKTVVKNRGRTENLSGMVVAQNAEIAEVSILVIDHGVKYQHIRQNKACNGVFQCI